MKKIKKSSGIIIRKDGLFTTEGKPIFPIGGDWKIVSKTKKCKECGQIIYSDTHWEKD